MTTQFPRYFFTLTNSRNEVCPFRYQSYRMAEDAARRNGRQPVYFLGDDGMGHLCEPISGNVTVNA